MKISTAFTSFCLKIVGGVILISSLFDFAFLLIPLEWQKPEWQITFTNQIVDRGIVPMVGMAFLIVGWWLMDNVPNTDAKASGAIRLPVFFIASFLGLVFLLLVPLHLGNISKASDTALSKISEQAGQQEQKIQAFIQQINDVARNPQQLDGNIKGLTQVIETGQFQGRRLTEQELQSARSQRDQFQQLLDLSKKPTELKQRLDKLKGELQTKLGELRTEQEKAAKTIATKQILRTGVSSLMLAIGYIVIGGLGLKTMVTPKTATRKA